MNELAKHSLKNYSEAKLKGFLSEGVAKVAEIMGMDKDSLTNFIKEQEEIIRERAKNETIFDNSIERIELREKIIREYFDYFKNTDKNHHAIIVLGQIASGKSSYCRKIAERTNTMIVDSDYIKQGHDSMDGLKMDFDYGKGTDMIHEEASMLAKKIINEAGGMGYNLILPKTGIDPLSIQKIVNNLKSFGYHITLVYIDLSIEKCIERNYYRFIDEYRRGIPSRLVPFKTIAKIDDKPFKTFVKMVREQEFNGIDKFLAYSNNVGINENMVSLSIDEMLKFDLQDNEYSDKINLDEVLDYI